MVEAQADVVVVGAGPAGMAAAISATACGKSVVVVDESPRPGGQIWRHRPHATLPRIAQRWLTRFERSAAKLISGATVVDIAQGAVRAERAGASLIVTGRSIILCVGARELWLPFPGWTLPGVLGVGGAQALLKAGMQVAGKRVVIAGSGPLLLPVAAAFAKQGAHVQLVAEQAPRARLAQFAVGLWRHPVKLLEAARYRAAFASTKYWSNAWVTRARGDNLLREVEITNGKQVRVLPCDVLCIGYGLVPSTELPRLARCELERSGQVRVDALQQTTQEHIYCAGETTGIAGVEAALIEGQIAGYAAAGCAQRARPLFGKRAAQQRFARALQDAFSLRTEVRSLAEPDTLICRCEDVPLSELQGYTSLREAKLCTRAGMGPCQSRVCGAALQQMFGWSPDTVRTPVAAATVGTLAND